MNTPTDFVATLNPYYDALRHRWAEAAGWWKPAYLNPTCEHCEESTAGRAMHSCRWWVCDTCAETRPWDEEGLFPSDEYERRAERSAMGIGY